MCLAQGPQRSDAGEVQTHGPSVSSQHSTIEPLRSQQLYYESKERSLVQNVNNFIFDKNVYKFNCFSNW